MKSLTSLAPTATPIDAGVIPYLATVGNIIVLTGDGYRVTAAVPSTETDALAFVSATVTSGGDAVTLSDGIYSLGSSGLQIVAGESTAVLVQSTYGSGYTATGLDAFGLGATVVTESGRRGKTGAATETGRSSTRGSMTVVESSSSFTSSAAAAAATPTAATTSLEASMGSRQMTVVWSVGGVALLATIVCLL